jgi:hypothetical protein
MAAARPNILAHDELPAPRPGHVRRRRVVLADGARTTVYVAGYDAVATEVRVMLLRRPEPLAAWCAARGIPDAIVGGFFTRPAGVPLGELRTRGIARRSVPFDSPWHALRGCVHVAGGRAGIARRAELERAPRGDLLQAGPVLVRDGRRVVSARRDPEGFSAGARQFDSDITAGRYPRAALALAPGWIGAVACDGRSRGDAGLTLSELADLLVGLGARDAINLDGGGSTSLVAGGRLRNRPRADVGAPIPAGRAVSTALAFLPRD